jgi:hypothetical protein|nr:MAG TPA: GHMP-like switch protein [Caudoviricetes sp.]
MAGTYLDTSVVGLNVMGDGDFYDLARRVNAELDKRSFLSDCKGEVDKKIDTYIEYASKEAKNIKALQPDAMIGPGELLSVDGKIYKNVARAWLNPFKAGPLTFINGWEVQQGGVL